MTIAVEAIELDMRCFPLEMLWRSSLRKKNNVPTLGSNYIFSRFVGLLILYFFDYIVILKME